MLLTKVKWTVAVILCVAAACLAGSFCLPAPAGDARETAAPPVASKDSPPTPKEGKPDKKEEKAPPDDSKDQGQKKADDKDAPRVEVLRAKLKQLEADGKLLMAELKKELDLQAKKADEDLAKAREAISKAKGDRDEIRKATEAMRKALDARHRIMIEQGKLHAGLTIRPADRQSAKSNPEKELGLSTEPATATLAAQLGLGKDQGRVIGRVEADSIAAKAGLKPHDVLVQINKKAAPSATAAFRQSLEGLAPGTDVELTIARKGKQQTLSLTMPGKKEESKEQPKKESK